MKSLSAALKARLLSSRNPDGGWPYYQGKTSRLEPTAWALLALRATGDTVPADSLASWPRQGGWLVDRSSETVNVAFNALAGIALQALGAAEPLTDAIEAALLTTHGRQLPQADIIRQNNALRAWPWTDGTFSWTEPTAWAMLFLKRRPSARRDPQTRLRLDEAERLLVDRMCDGGGWNYGNANIFGTPLDPYIATSALCLMALADKAHLPAVATSKRFLSAHRLAERSAMALGLTRIALGVLDEPANDVDAAIADLARHTAFLDNIHLTAVALYAIAGARRGYQAFDV